MIHDLFSSLWSISTLEWTPQSSFNVVEMLALLAVLLAGFLLLKFMNDDQKKRLEKEVNNNLKPMVKESEPTVKLAEDPIVIVKKTEEQLFELEIIPEAQNFLEAEIVHQRVPNPVLKSEDRQKAIQNVDELLEELLIYTEMDYWPADPVFVAPPPPQDDMDHPLPTICVLNKSSPSDEFGFNLHAEKGRGHFIGTVDADGIGDCAGLLLGQRIVGVNGTLVYPNTPHKEVVALIKRSPMSTTLLLASEDVDQWYKQHNEEFSFDKARRALEPVQPLSPHSIQISDEEILEETPSPAPRHEEPKIEEALPLPRAVHYEQPPMAQYDLVPDNDVDIMTAVFGQVSVPEVGAGLAVHEPVAHEQAHLVEHHGHQEPALKADIHFEEHHEAAVPAYNAYASSPVSVHHQVEEHHVHHHDNHYHADYNHNGHSHDHYHNGKSNGYSSNASDSSDLDIFHLSAKEARERLRQQKKRPQDMSLEEKYRLVSNM